MTDDTRTGEPGTAAAAVAHEDVRASPWGTALRGSGAGSTVSGPVPADGLRAALDGVEETGSEPVRESCTAARRGNERMPGQRRGLARTVVAAGAAIAGPGSTVVARRRSAGPSLPERRIT